MRRPCDRRGYCRLGVRAGPGGVAWLTASGARPPSRPTVAHQARRPVYSLEVFPAIAALFDVDPLRFQVVVGIFDRGRRRPAPICTTCDYEFVVGEAPPLVWALRPELPAEPAEGVLAGQVCRRCAALGAGEVTGAVIGRLRAIMPDLELCQAGRA